MPSITGISISEAELPRIFDKFTRASNAQNEKRIGTGIGLFLAKQITELHDGVIDKILNYNR